MSTKSATKSHRLFLVAVPVIAGLIAAGCSSSPSGSSADEPASTAPTTSVVTESTVPVDPLDAKIGGATTTTAPAPAPTPAPGADPDPAPPVTLGPPASIYVPIITLAPILFYPTVNTVTASSNPSCVEVALAGFTTSVSWTTFNAASVTVQVGGFTFSGLPANGSLDVPVSCGIKNYITVTAMWGDGAEGGSKTTVVKVSAT